MHQRYFFLITNTIFSFSRRKRMDAILEVPKVDNSRFVFLYIDRESRKNIAPLLKEQFVLCIHCLNTPLLYQKLWCLTLCEIQRYKKENMWD